MLLRTGSHSHCPAKYPPQLVLFHRESGARGEVAQQMLAEFKRRKMPFLGEECCRRNPLLEMPQMLSPLPPSPRLDAFSNKRKWDHDPVNIEILEPSEEAYVETKEFDKMTTNVFFPSPISTLTTVSEFSPVKVKSLCLNVNSKSENKVSKKLEDEQKARQNKRQESEEKSKQSQKISKQKNKVKILRGKRI